MNAEQVFKNWSNFFKEKGLSEEIMQKYLLYISKLLKNGAPIIFEFNHLALLFGRSTPYLASVINSPTNHYRFFKIKKRSGGFREICVPFPALLEMQYWIFENILKSIKINSSAHGFAHKKSIITNAKIHAGRDELLKLDLENFFPSININRIIFIFKSLGYPNEIAFYLAAICSDGKGLPQGAPTSPIISNIVAKGLDNRLIHLAKKYNLKYTRYADDLTFSGSEIPAKLIDYIEDIVQDEGFKLNSKKTRLYKSKGKRIVTGISVLEKTIKLPREYKRNLRQELNFIFKYGYISHVKKLKIRKANYLPSLIGKVNFWISVEPQSDFALSAKKKLLQLLKNRGTVE